MCLLLTYLKTNSLLYPKIRSSVSLNAQVSQHSLAHRRNWHFETSDFPSRINLSATYLLLLFLLCQIIIILCGCNWWNRMRGTLKTCLLPLCGSTPTNTTAASVELRSLVFTDIHMAGKCST